MPRYIDADNLIDYIRTLSIWSKTYEVEALRAINELLNQIPTAEVRENVKGEWIEVIDIGYHGWRCNLCGEDSYRKSNYCPNCGADMRKEETE